MRSKTQLFYPKLHTMIYKGFQESFWVPLDDIQIIQIFETMFMFSKRAGSQYNC